MNSNEKIRILKAAN